MKNDMLKNGPLILDVEELAFVGYQARLHQPSPPSVSTGCVEDYTFLIRNTGGAARTVAQRPGGGG